MYKNLYYYISELAQIKKELKYLNETLLELDFGKNNKKYVELDDRKKNLVHKINELKRELLVFYQENPDDCGVLHKSLLNQLLMS